MNGAQDMGGMMGFGPVQPEKDESVFHASWERRTFALNLAMAVPGGWNIDQSRFARESLNPAAYLSKSYYELWLAGLEKLLTERGLVSTEEIAAGHAQGPVRAVDRILKAESVEAGLAKGRPTQRDPVGQARFGISDTVRARLINPTEHTRLPRYVRGRVGVITHNHGCHVFPDAHAAGRGEEPQWLYTVRFAARDIWGEKSDPTVTVSVDAWESYLERPAAP